MATITNMYALESALPKFFPKGKLWLERFLDRWSYGLAVRHREVLVKEYVDIREFDSRFCTFVLDLYGSMFKDIDNYLNELWC